MSLQRLILLLSIIIGFAAPLNMSLASDENNQEETSTELQEVADQMTEIFDENSPHNERSMWNGEGLSKYYMPILNFILPGFHDLTNGDYKTGAMYAGTSAALQGASWFLTGPDDFLRPYKGYLDAVNMALRALSTYQVFNNYQEYGVIEVDSPTKEYTTEEVLKAPFTFDKIQGHMGALLVVNLITSFQGVDIAGSVNHLIKNPAILIEKLVKAGLFSEMYSVYQGAFIHGTAQPLINDLVDESAILTIPLTTAFAVIFNNVLLPKVGIESVYSKMTGAAYYSYLTYSYDGAFDNVMIFYYWELFLKMLLL